jgi:phosphonate transport system substrate-binding protein
LSFADSEAGKDYFAKNKLGGYRKLSVKDLEVMDPYAAEVRAQVKKIEK